MKWLITGGAGFIGCHAAVTLHNAGHTVVVLDDLSRPGSEHNLAWLKASGVTAHIRADITDAAAVDAAFAAHADADVVLHLAAQVAVTTSVVNPRHDFAVNALGTFNLLEATRTVAGGQPAFLYASTNKVYGGLEHLRLAETATRWELADRPDGIAEDEPLDFHSPYGCSKGAADQYVRDYSRIYGLRTVVFRQSCIYGTRQFGVEDQGWIAWFVIAATTGRAVTVFGDGKQVRDALWANDLVDLYVRAVERIDRASGQVFNVGGGPANSLSLLDLLARMEGLAGRPLEHTFAAERPGDQKVFVSCNRKAEQVLGWRPAVGLDAGLEQLARWIRDNADSLRAVRSLLAAGK
jgi:CDP-paratose 2-epimerase